MAEPSLSEISNISSDPERSGIAPVPVVDNSKMVANLNENARFHAENTWRKYNQFLENKKELFKNIGEIQGLEVAPEDRDVLKQQAADILGDILKDPTIAMGGQGYDQLQGKIAKFKSDATASKQDKLDFESDKKFMDRNPDLYTDENVALLNNNIKSPLGTRKSVLLQMPTIFDEKSTFENILKGTTQPYTDIVGPDGKPGAGYIESGNEVNPNAISSLWKMALQGQKDKYGHSILNSVTKQFNALPPDEQKKYGTVENYFADKGQKYLGAYFPEGSYDKTQEGNYRFGKKLTADPNYLGAERLSLQQRELNEKTRYDKARIAVDWGELGIKRDKLNQTKGEDLSGAETVLNQAAGAIRNGIETEIFDKSTGKNVSVLRISDPTVLQKFATLDKEGNIVNSPDRMDFVKGTNQVLLHFYDPDKTENAAGGNTIVKTIPMDQRVWLKTITSTSFPNKDIGGINKMVEDALKSNNNSIYEISQKLIKQNQQPAAQTQPAPAAPAKTKKGLPVFK